jgi:phosphatidylglycerophosphatase C
MAPDPHVTVAGVAAFDFDGTLVLGDSLPWFLSRVLGRARLARVLSTTAPAMAQAYRHSGRDGAKVALLGRALAGLDASEVARAGEGFGAVLARRIRRPMRERLAWHDDRGHTRILVSASLAVYLEPFGRLTGFDHVIATALEVDETGQLTGRLEGRNVRAQQKALRLAAVLPTPVELWAYGDSAGDREMLAMADHPVLVSWRRRLSPPTSIELTES